MAKKPTKKQQVIHKDPPSKPQGEYRVRYKDSHKYYPWETLEKAKITAASLANWNVAVQVVDSEDKVVFEPPLYKDTKNVLS